MSDFLTTCGFSCVWKRSMDDRNSALFSECSSCTQVMMSRPVRLNTNLQAEPRVRACTQKGGSHQSQAQDDEQCIVSGASTPPETVAILAKEPIKLANCCITLEYDAPLD